ncbi:MAG: hypothetical protein J6Y28_08670 [Acholeplasmatales bacterium]|nr:hypothetical protein [Acholeplasmatales bacterium]
MFCDELKLYLDKIATGVKQAKLNQFHTRPTYFKLNIENSQIFNEIYFKLRDSNLNKIIRTDSGAISTAPVNEVNNRYAWDCIKTSTFVRLTIILGSHIYVISIGKGNINKEKDIRPIDAWLTFISELKNDGIDINDYIIDNGAQVKETIKKPLIWVDPNDINKTFINAHHIDYHNSYPAGLCNKYQEFTKTCVRLYNQRKDEPVFKAVLNYTISGCMQSPKKPWCCKWAHLSKAAIEDNIDRILTLSYILQLEGRHVIAYNTDGIWYSGDIYHGDGEGKNLGDWENDHVNCILRFRSAGCYEYMENDEYHPVVRGTSTYDIIEPDRSNWKWGDIYKQETITFKFDEEKGITLNET